MPVIEQTAFGSKSTLYRLTNANGLQVTVTDFGARIVDILVPVTGEEPRAVSMACATEEDYRAIDTYLGATIVPVAGRISGAQAEIAGERFAFTANEPNRTLHGGIDTANEQIWASQVDEATNSISFSYTLPDGKNGFPGPLHVTARYQLREDNGLVVTYEGRSEKATLFNPTNHVYFNLTGNFQEPVDGHRMTVAGERFATLNEHNLPSGDLVHVAGTGFDFRAGQLFGDGFASSHEQVVAFKGYDHPWLLDDVAEQVRVTSPDDKVRLVVSTNQPSVVIYTYNHGPTPAATFHGGFSMECQGLPDACNQEGFGSIELPAGQTYTSETVYRLEWD